MYKKWIIALLSVSLFSTAYFADEKKGEGRPSKESKGQKGQNHGKVTSEERNKGKQGEKMSKEHGKKHEKDSKGTEHKH